MWDTLDEIKKQKYHSHKKMIVNKNVLTANRKVFYQLKQDRLNILFALFDGAYETYEKRAKENPELEKTLKQIILKGKEYNAWKNKILCK